MSGAYMNESKAPSEAAGRQLLRPARRMLRLRGVEECVGFSRSAIYRAMEDDGFPRPVRIGRRAVAWVESEVQAWLDIKLAERGGRA